MLKKKQLLLLLFVFVMPVLLGRCRHPGCKCPITTDYETEKLNGETYWDYEGEYCDECDHLVKVHDSVELSSSDESNSEDFQSSSQENSDWDDSSDHGMYSDSESDESQ